MQPIWGFLLYFVACIVVAIVASKRGRSAMKFGFLSLFSGFPLVVFASNAGASGFGAALVGFLSPVVGFVIALSTKTASDLAIQEGSFGEYRKCPFCAEAVRKEAIKCKHCGSEITSKTSSQPSAEETTAPAVDDRLSNLIAMHGATKVGDAYEWQGRTYTSPVELEAAILSGTRSHIY